MKTEIVNKVTPLRPRSKYSRQIKVIERSYSENGADSRLRCIDGTQGYSYKKLVKTAESLRDWFKRHKQPDARLSIRCDRYHGLVFSFKPRTKTDPEQ